MIGPCDWCLWSPVSSFNEHLGPGKRNRASSGNVVPITRECLLSMEPGPHTDKRKNREAGSDGSIRAASSRVAWRATASDHLHLGTAVRPLSIC